MTRSTIATALSLASLLAVRAVPAQDPDELREQWFALYEQHAESIDMQADSERDSELELQLPPLLKYTNPVRGVQQHGSILVWTKEGRPAVIASIWSALDRAQPELRKLNYEWHSLSVESVTAQRAGEQLWDSAEPGVEWQPIGTQLPAGSRALRLTQMRRLAQSLASDIDVEEGELRLMSQPLYRYPEGTPNVLDGALFAFVMGTDPEVFVLLEATGDGADQTGWQIAFARFTNWPVSVLRDQRELWSCDRARPFEATGRYYLWFAVDRLPADLSTDALESRVSGN